MSSVAALLELMRERGIELRLEGDKLLCSAPQGSLTPELAKRIREEKPELVRVLSAAVRAEGSDAQIPRAPVRDIYPLAPTQRRNLYAAAHGPGLPSALRLRGELDRAALEATLSHIVARHAPLRSVFILNGDEPMQAVRASVPVELPLEDLSAESGARSTLDERLRGLAEQPFDLVNGPLFRFRLFRTGEDEHVLFLAFSQMVFDGWSLDVFLADFRAGYAELSAGRGWPLVELGTEYVDYVGWKRRRIEERRVVEQAFWRDRLSDELPPAPLPTDRPRPVVASYVGGSVAVELAPDLIAAVRRVARERGTTAQMVLLAGVVTLISRLGGTRDVVVATPIDGRTHPSVEPMAGAFINLLIVRIAAEPQMTFSRLLEITREVCLSAYEHQELPVDELGLRVQSGDHRGLVPLWQLEFSYQQVSTRRSSLGSLSLEHIELHGGGAPNELTFWLKDTGEHIDGAMVFAVDLFDRETVEHWVGCYMALLSDALSNPERELSALDVLGPERRRVESSWQRALSSAPDWWGEKVGRETAPGEFRIVDDQGHSVPLGVWGSVNLSEWAPAERLRVTAAGCLERAPGRRSAPDVERRAWKRNDPVDVVELRLLDELSSALGVARVGLHDSFFDLGGHSLVGVKYLERVYSHFGVRLALGTLFEAPSPYLLARRVRAECGIPDPETGECERPPTREWTSIVPIQPRGARPPLFAVAGIGGNPMNLRYLARCLGDDQPFYGLQHRGTDGRAPPHESVSDMAAEYVAHIRRVQPHGPYFVGGFSAGGVAAFEVARLLRAEGELVGLVFMLDANSTLVKKASPERRWAEHRIRLRERGARYPVEFVVGHLRSWMARLRVAVAARLVRLQPYRFRNEAVTTAWSRALRAYRPAPYDGDVLVLRARTRDEWTFDDTNGWRPLVRGRLEVVEVEGGHTTHVLEEHAATTAAVLRERLDRALLPAVTGPRSARGTHGPESAGRTEPVTGRSLGRSCSPRAGREPAGA